MKTESKSNLDTLSIINFDYQKLYNNRTKFEWNLTTFCKLRFGCWAGVVLLKTNININVEKLGHSIFNVELNVQYITQWYFFIYSHANNSNIREQYYIILFYFSKLYSNPTPLRFYSVWNCNSILEWHKQDTTEKKNWKRKKNYTHS